MANFLIPFGNSAEKRFPTADERANGFPCGPADIRLFNGMFWRIEAELNAVLAEGGITPSDASFTQVRDAILAMIEAATGGGVEENYVLMTQARLRLPIYPDVQTADGKIGVTTTGPGNVRIPAAVKFLHRGIFEVTTAVTDFVTTASQTYHLRWSPTNGYQLKNLADVAYNPGAAVESSEGFDSKYDDMLIARVITNSSNVVTITDLVNKARLESEQQATGAGSIITTGSGYDGVQYDATFALNWSRQPVISMYGWTGNAGGAVTHGYANAISVGTKNRYSVIATVSSDYNNDQISAPYGLLRLTATR